MQFLPSRTHMASECSLLASSQGDGKGLINQPTCGIATVVEAQKLAELYTKKNMQSMFWIHTITTIVTI